MSSTTRPDGSVRKEPRVRPGYIPSEQVPAYVPPMLRKAVEERVIRFEDIPPTDYHHYRYSLRNGHYVIIRDEE